MEGAIWEAFVHKTLRRRPPAQNQEAVVVLADCKRDAVRYRHWELLSQEEQEGLACEAVKEGMGGRVASLIEYGRVRVEATSESGLSLLRMAVSHQHVAVVQYLLERGADASEAREEAEVAVPCRADER